MSSSKSKLSGLLMAELMPAPMVRVSISKVTWKAYSLAISILSRHLTKSLETIRLCQLRTFLLHFSKRYCSREIALIMALIVTISKICSA